MLKLLIPSKEIFNQETSEFLMTKEMNLQLEHSLVSLAKWESKWHKPFISNQKKTFLETVDYIRCMTITQNMDLTDLQYIGQEIISQVNSYIDDPMTATTFSNENKKPSREIITAEIIYYWMIAFNIPMECQKWHLNRLLTLISVCNIKNKPAKKMNRREHFQKQAALNAARRAQLNTTG